MGKSMSPEDAKVDGQDAAVRRALPAPIGLRRPGEPCRGAQRLVEIGEDVVDMLDADRQAHIVVR